MTIRRRLRPTNSLKDLKQLLGSAGVAHGKARSECPLAADLFQLVAYNQVFHFLEYGLGSLLRPHA